MFGLIWWTNYQTFELRSFNLGACFHGATCRHSSLPHVVCVICLVLIRIDYVILYTTIVVSSFLFDSESCSSVHYDHELILQFLELQLKLCTSVLSTTP